MVGFGCSIHTKNKSFIGENRNTRHASALVETRVAAHECTDDADNRGGCYEGLALIPRNFVLDAYIILGYYIRRVDHRRIAGAVAEMEHRRASGSGDGREQPEGKEGGVFCHWRYMCVCRY